MTDPFAILEVSPGADKRQILQAAAKQLRAKRHSALTIAQAQRELLACPSSAALAFVHVFDLPPSVRDVDGLDWSESGNEGVEQRLTLFDAAP